MFKGLILKESLISEDFLSKDLITIEKKVIWKIGKRAVPWQPDTWTALYLEGKDEDIEYAAVLISKSIKNKWYANLSDASTEYVIFQNKIFSYLKGDIYRKQVAQEYARSIGVPEHQLDW